MRFSSTSGPGIEYSPDEGKLLTEVLREAFAEFGDGEPTGAYVTAQIEWAGTITNNGHNGVRTTQLGMDEEGIRAVRLAIDESPETAPDRLTEALSKSYGATVRFRDIESWEWA